MGWVKQQRFIVTDRPSFPQNGNPSVFGVGNIAAQPRSMQQPPAQPLNSSQPNPRAQVPPPLLSPQVSDTENTLCIKHLNAASGNCSMFVGDVGIYSVNIWEHIWLECVQASADQRLQYSPCSGLSKPISSGPGVCCRFQYHY